MESIRQYIWNVIAASIVCSLVSAFSKSNKTTSKVLRIISGVFLVTTIILPFKSVDQYDLSDMISSYDTWADEYVNEGVSFGKSQKQAIIIENVQSYILDRAKEMGVNIDVTVELDKESSLPNIVYLSGNISPIKKERLQHTITDGLGIPEEQQIWE